MCWPGDAVRGTVTVTGLPVHCVPKPSPVPLAVVQRTRVCVAMIWLSNLICALLEVSPLSKPVAPIEMSVPAGPAFGSRKTMGTTGVGEAVGDGGEVTV